MSEGPSTQYAEARDEVDKLFKVRPFICGRAYVRPGLPTEYIPSEGQLLYVDTDVIVSAVLMHACKHMRYSLWKYSRNFLELPFSNNIKIVTSSATRKQFEFALNNPDACTHVNGSAEEYIGNMKYALKHGQRRFLANVALNYFDALPISVVKDEFDFDPLYEDLSHRKAAEKLGADYFVTRDWSLESDGKFSILERPPECFVSRGRIKQFRRCPRKCSKGETAHR